MLAVKHLNVDTSCKVNSILCPVCLKGRLCDKPKEEKVKVVPVHVDLTSIPGNHIILKCPKCGAISQIYMLKE